MLREHTSIILKYLIISEEKFDSIDKLIKLLESRSTFSVEKKDEETMKISLLDKNIVCDNVNAKLITLRSPQPKSCYIIVFNFNELSDAENFRRALIIDISKMSDINIGLLSDGISKEYSVKAYDILHDVENSIRSFITELMVFYGKPEWYKKDAKEILKLDNKNIERHGIKILYERNFDQLKEFLFTDYSDSSYKDLIDEIIHEEDERKKMELAKGLKNKMPTTNWDKLVAKHANKNSISGEQYKNLLERIYDKRNKIAHCNEFHKESFDEFKKDCEIIMEQTKLLISIIEEKKTKQNDSDDLREDVSAIFSPDSLDTIIVPAKDDGFQEVFLKQGKWYSVAIHEGRKDFIKYVAAYRVQPIQKITHYAEVDKIEKSPYDSTKKIIYFKSDAIELSKPIKLGRDKHAFQRSRYTSFSKFDNAETTDDLL